MTICFGSGATTPALDIALIKDATTTNRVVRLAVDPSGRITNALTATSGCTGAPAGSTYTHSYTIPAASIGTNTKLITVRVLYGKSALYFRRPTTTLPHQGVIIEAAATSNDTNVTKKVRVFETYPQIPPDIFSLTH